MKKILSILLSITLILTVSNFQVASLQGQTETNWLEASQTSDYVLPQASLMSVSSTPTGWLEWVTTSEIRGWAYSPDAPNTSIGVHTYITNTQSGAQTIMCKVADIYRDDLLIAGYGNGCHGFSYGIDWCTYIPGEYSIVTYAIGTDGVNPSLQGTPKYYTVRNVVGHVETLSDNMLRGWVWKPDSPNNSLQIHVYIRNSLGDVLAVYFVDANIYRQDLEIAGFGNGYHGFEFQIPWDTLPEEELSVSIYSLDGSGFNPSFYNGTYDNSVPFETPFRMYPINWSDFPEKDRDTSSFLTTGTSNNFYIMGAPGYSGVSKTTPDEVLDFLGWSSLTVAFTHGSKTTLQFVSLEGNVYSLEYRDIDYLEDGALSGSHCVIYACCSAGEGAEGAENLVNITNQKGVKTVIGWETNQSAEALNYWLSYFFHYCAEGYTVLDAATTAITDTLDSLGDVRNHSIDQIYIAGSKSQKLKH